MARCIGSSSELRAPSCSRGGCACANDARAWGGKVECKGGRPKAKRQTRRPVEGSNRMKQPRPHVKQSTQSHKVLGKLSLASAAAVIDAIRLQKKCAAGRSRHATSASMRSFSSVFYIEASSPLMRAAGATSATPSEKIEECMARKRRGARGPGPPAAAEEMLRAIAKSEVNRPLHAGLTALRPARARENALARARARGPRGLGPASWGCAIAGSGEHRTAMLPR